MNNRALLEKPFASEQIRQRKGSFGDVLDYVEAADVVQRLNDVLEAEWSFTILDHKVYEDEVVVLGQLSTNGVSKTQFGKSKITRSKVDQALVSLGDDLKAAASDSLKKCATLLGVGLHLYLENRKHRTEAGNGSEERASGNGRVAGNGRVSARQLSAIFSIGKSHGMDNNAIKDYTKEAFGKLPDFLTRQEASLAIQRLQEGAQ